MHFCHMLTLSLGPLQIRKAGQPSSATKGVPEMLPEARELASSLYE